MSPIEALAAPPHPQVSADEELVAANDDALSTSNTFDAERRLRMLKEMSEIGMELMRSLQRQVIAAEADTQSATPVADPAGAFAKLSRAVRLTLNFEIRAEEALRALHAGETVAREERRAERQRREDEAQEEQTAKIHERIFAPADPRANPLE